MILWIFVTAQLRMQHIYTCSHQLATLNIWQLDFLLDDSMEEIQNQFIKIWHFLEINFSQLVQNSILANVFLFLNKKIKILFYSNYSMAPKCQNNIILKHLESTILSQSFTPLSKKNIEILMRYQTVEILIVAMYDRAWL